MFDRSNQLRKNIATRLDDRCQLVERALATFGMVVLEFAETLHLQELL